MENRQSVVIIGGGPAGLSAALECARRNISPLVLERADRVGGISRTEEYKGYLFDIGGHRFFSKIERINQLWQEMLGDDFIKVSRLSRIYYQGRFFSYPLQCANALINLGLVESALIVMSYGRAQLRSHAGEESFEQWVSNRFGDRLFRTFFKTYTEKVWGIPCHEIRADWAAQRIKGLSLSVALVNALFGSGKAKSLIDSFDYPVRGPGMMWHRFKEEVCATGGEVSLHCTVTGLEHDQGVIRKIIWDNCGEICSLPVENVISSIPLTRLVGLLDPPPAVVAAADKLAYRSFLIVVLIIKQPDLFPDQWIYVHSPEVKVGRIQNFKNWSAAMVPDSGTTSIGMEYFCDQGDPTWSLADTELIRLATFELAGLGLANGDTVIDGCVIRQPKAYPVYDRYYNENVAILRDYLAGFSNLQTVGRNGMHRYNNMDHSMQTGLLAAENLSGAQHDLWRVNVEDDYLEEDRGTSATRAQSTRMLRRTFARMDKFAFATAVGVVCGLIVLMANLWTLGRVDDPAASHLRLLAQYFIGYTVSTKGALIAFAYTFFWAFLMAWLFAYLRNFFLACYIFQVRKRNELLTLKDFFDHL